MCNVEGQRFVARPNITAKYLGLLPYKVIENAPIQTWLFCYKQRKAFLQLRHYFAEIKGAH